MIWRIKNRHTFKSLQILNSAYHTKCRFVIRHIAQTETETLTELLRRHSTCNWWLILSDLAIMCRLGLQNLKQNIISIGNSTRIGGFGGGRKGHAPPPWASKCLRFHAVFWENLAKSYVCAPPPGIGPPPPPEKSWIRHWPVTLITSDPNSNTLFYTNWALVTWEIFNFYSCTTWFLVVDDSIRINRAWLVSKSLWEAWLLFPLGVTFCYWIFFVFTY